MDPRPEEAAALLKDAVQVRDGVFRIRFEKRPDATMKNDDSERLVPIPEVLIRLASSTGGAPSWPVPASFCFRSFPRARPAERPRTSLASVAAGSSNISVFAMPAKDFYAGRMTVSTQLLAAGAPDHVLESILGHEHNAIINRHYTEANLRLMKEFLDRIDLGLVIEFDARHRFPVIRKCALLKERPLAVTLTLDAADQPKCIEIHEPSMGATHIITPERAFDAKDPAAWRTISTAWVSVLRSCFGGGVFALKARSTRRSNGRWVWCSQSDFRICQHR